MKVWFLCFSASLDAERNLFSMAKDVTYGKFNFAEANMNEMNLPRQDFLISSGESRVLTKNLWIVSFLQKKMCRYDT